MFQHNFKKGFATPLILGVALFIILAGGVFYYATRDTKMTGEMKKEDDAAMMEEKTDVMMDGKDNDAMKKEDDAMMKDEESSTIDKGSDSMMQKGSYETYSPEKLSFASNGKVLLFFHASWCPICRAIESEINANPTAISDGVHILKVDYDMATQLRQKYGVTVQHTFVQVDTKGDMISKWSDSSTLAQALTRVK